MSLRDDLELCFARIGKQVHTNEVIAIAEAMNRLRAVLTPAAEKWLEILPKLLERCELGSHSAIVGQRGSEFLMWMALDEAARLHPDSSALNPKDNKEQK